MRLLRFERRTVTALRLAVLPLTVLFLLVPPPANRPGAGAAALEMDAETTAAIRVIDFRGRSLTLKQPARRLVCLIESALSGLYMLEAENRIVGVSTNVYEGEVYPYYAAMDPRIATKTLAAPGNWDFVSVERVVALEPDLVVIWAQQEESIRVLEERGIPVFGVFLRTFADVSRELRALGALTGTTERAEDLIRFTESELVKIQNLVAAASGRPRVYFMWAQGELESSGAGSTVDELIGLAGGTNVCGRIQQEHLVLNREQLLLWDPEVIVMWYNERLDPKDLLALPLWRSVSAVRQGRVHEFPGVFTGDLWTLKFQLAVLQAARWCHPELFPDRDPTVEQQRLLARLYGRNYWAAAFTAAASASARAGR